MLPDDTRFREALGPRLRRWILGTAYALRPEHALEVPALLWHCAGDLARGGTVLPDTSRTWPTPDTFAGVCRDITAERMVEAARKGFFAWAHCGPLKWWTREKRMVLVFNEHKLEKRCLREMKKNTYRVTFDTAFETVVRECAAPRSYNWHSLTWITPKMQKLYADLHRLGHAHSFEIWNADGALVGGGFGIAVGRVFLSDSLFSRERDVSKMVSSALYYHLAKWGYVLCDGRDYTAMQDAMGYREIPRAEYEAILTEHARAEFDRASWAVEADLATVAQWVSGNKPSAPKSQPAPQSKLAEAPQEAA